MCGIFCKYISESSFCDCKNHFEKDNRLKTLLKSRGPDAQNDLLLFGENFGTRPENDFCKHFIQFTGCTLWTQGKEPEVQPLFSEYGCLLFNGDIFDDSWDENQSDTRQLFEKLNPHDKDGLEIENHILNTLRNLNGPYSAIYLDKLQSKLYFCRDRLGRHSLLFSKLDDGFIISSVLTSEYDNALEIPSGCIYSIDLNTKRIQMNNFLEKNINYFDDWETAFTNNDSYLYSITEITNNDSLLIEEIEKYGKLFKNHTELFQNLLTLETMIRNVKNIIRLLSQSVKHRVETCPDIKSSKKCNIGILFSGGLDCTIIAAIANKFVKADQSIDLLNVAFERPNSTNYDVPDRITARQSYKELQELFPKRLWNLVEINITLDELHKKQSEIITDLVHPLQTVLDESLGSALWFAARGENEDYKSDCRVLLMGMGADELFGGYTRHRNAFKRQGWIGLEKELQMDWQRISSRNLARDDRVVSHHGRQPRTPYLDEKFSDYVVSLKPWEKCMPSADLGPGIGDKLLLRLAAFDLDLKGACSFPKRAIQFGSKIANKKENAADMSKKLIKNK